MSAIHYGWKLVLDDAKRSDLASQIDTILQKAPPPGYIPVKLEHIKLAPYFAVFHHVYNWYSSDGVHYKDSTISECARKWLDKRSKTPKDAYIRQIIYWSEGKQPVLIGELSIDGVWEYVILTESLTTPFNIKKAVCASEKRGRFTTYELPEKIKVICQAYLHQP